MVKWGHSVIADRIGKSGYIAEVGDIVQVVKGRKYPLGMKMVVTDMGIMKFDEETKRMYLAYYYPYTTPEEIKAAIPDFPLIVDERAQLMEGPSPEIIRTIREDIDPGQAFIKVPKA